MEKYQVIPINTGEFQAAEKSNFTYQVDAGVKIIAPLTAFLVKGKDKLVLVDTGGSDEEWARKYHHPIKQSEDQKPLNALKKLGVRPEDIDFVVDTHLHWDHCFNNALFTKAKIYVQQKELEYAISPLPPHYVYYESYQIGMYPQWLKSMERMVAVEGDYNLLPGIDLIFLPGHTPGFQGVLVNTEAGKCMIAGDTLPQYENWTGNPHASHLKRIVSGIHVNLFDYYRTMKRIEELSDYILPGHDLKVFEKAVYP
ncbi:MAG: N-acyl homoserine lactonase family protein [Peptococcaceae bacterium]|jgi:glyoxylase-like metal-dependent hydrolase (beta-lactamase superfamily II)|nr:N-acyl homoserine lactonase family protein [Peptococcaceae bacterium]MDH7525581.1 N-acyl homoserine lactonase family protein [Peptococcaceae bacterium]